MPKMKWNSPCDLQEKAFFKKTWSKISQIFVFIYLFIFFQLYTNGTLHIYLFCQGFLPRIQLEHWSLKDPFNNTQI